MGGAGASALLRLAALLWLLVARAAALSLGDTPEPVWEPARSPGSGRAWPWPRGDPTGGASWWPWPGDAAPVVPPGLPQNKQEGKIQGLLDQAPGDHAQKPSVPAVALGARSEPGAGEGPLTLTAMPSPAAPRCSTEERRAIRQETELMTRMVGYYTSTITVHASDPPNECAPKAMYVFNERHLRMELSRNRSLECFRAWGLTGPFAQCWATEQEWKELHCQMPCSMSYMQSQVPTMKDWWSNEKQDCAACTARHLAEKYVCTGRLNGVGQDCAVCRAEADVFYEDMCTRPCTRQIVYMGTPKIPVLSEEVSDECRRCGDRAYEMWMNCFPP